MRLPDDKKRQSILKAAALLFSTQPFHKVRLDDVAAAAGVGKGTLYIYFTNKEDLFFSILYGGFASLVDRLAEQLREDHSPPWQRLELIVKELVDFAFSHPEIFELMRKIGLPATGNAEWNERREELTRLIQQTLEQGVQAGEFADPNPGLTALYLPGLVRSAMLYGPKGLDRQALAGHMLNLLAKGIMKDHREK
jgi:AcrR family transcriptional regulator